MKGEFPNYKGIKVFNIKLKPKDEEYLNNFLKLCEGSAGEKKVKNIHRIMIQIYDVSEIGFDEWDLNKLRDFLSILNKSSKLNSTKNDIKKVLKRFLKEHYENWSIKFKNFADPSMKQKDEVNHEKLNATTMLKPNEFEILVKGADSFRMRSWISLSYESAGRPEEILKLKWSDIDLEKGRLKLHSSKTGNVRVIPIKDCILHLRQYKQEYPFEDVKASDFVFPSPMDRNKQISLQTIYTYIKTLGKNKLKRHIFPYLFRHTKLSFLHTKLSPKNYENFADHSISTAIKHYSHLGEDDLREEMFDKVFKIEELSEEENNKIKELEAKLSKMEKQHRLMFNAIKDHNEFLKKEGFIKK